MQREQELSGKQGLKNIIWYWMPLIGYLGVIFYFSHLSEPTQGVELPISDKVIHFLEYFPLPFLFFRVLRNVPHRPFAVHYVLWGIVLSLLYAASDEFHQMFITLREASLLDFIADGAGIALGALCMRDIPW
ncbi:MAG: VanZ family protein [Candidatus Omnitrophica bacterium]|nr:VanZ family protein [Candidatus Omnitrophota bacterium]